MTVSEANRPGEEVAAALTQQWVALNHVRSEEQLKVLIADMKSIVWRHHAKRYLRRLFPFMLLIGVVFSLLYNETVQESAFIYSRLFLIKVVFPVVNLPKWSRITCLIDNPTYNPDLRQRPSTEECQHCLGLSRPLSMPAENFTVRSFHRDFLEGDTPVIIHGGSSGWLLENMTVEHLHEFYMQDELLKRTLACSMITDQRIGRNNNKLLLRWVMDKKPASWFALWEHCSLPQIKAFRPLYRRPSFLPPSVSIGGEDMRSWVVLGRQPDASEPVQLPFKGAYFFLGQVRGQMAVRLEANPACSFCKSMDFNLAAGDLLLISEIYELSVMPSGSAFSLAFGFAGES